MVKYLSVSEYAALHHKDPGNIRRYLASGRIQGIKIGNQWVIPSDAEYPADLRAKTGRYKNWRGRVEFNSHKELAREIYSMIADFRSLYENILQSVVVYGSYARGTQTEESDVDIAVFVNGKMTVLERDAFIDCVARHELECGRTLSVIDIDYNDFNERKDNLPFYRNIEKEGIVLWKK